MVIKSMYNSVSLSFHYTGQQHNYYHDTFYFNQINTI